MNVVVEKQICTKPLARQTLRVRYCGIMDFQSVQNRLSPLGVKLHNFNPLQAKVDSIPID